MRGPLQRPKMIHGAIGIRIYHAFERDPSVFHDDVNRGISTSAFVDRIPGVNSAVHIPAEGVISRECRQHLDVIDYFFNSRELPDCALRSVFYFLAYHL